MNIKFGKWLGALKEKKEEELEMRARIETEANIKAFENRNNSLYQVENEEKENEIEKDETE